MHVPLQQTVQFQSGFEKLYVAQALSRRTKLEAWLDLNARAARSSHANADLIRRLRYSEIPQHFRWDATSCSWVPRQRRGRRGHVVARMRYVKPSAGELYYLRLLLLHVSGAFATSWDSLRSASTINGPTTFQQKARDLHLLHDDEETIGMLSEAARLVTTTTKICELFAETMVCWSLVRTPA